MRALIALISGCDDLVRRRVQNSILQKAANLYIQIEISCNSDKIAITCRDNVDDGLG